MPLTPHTDTGELLRGAPEHGLDGIAAVLRAVGAWRSDADTKHQLQLDEVDDEVGRLKSAIEDLQRQLTALGDFRGELVENHGKLDSEQARRAHDGIFERLNTAADELEQRAEAYAECAPRRAKVIAERFAASDKAAQLDEYRTFKSTLDQLAKLPASYRDALMSHHKAQEAALAAFAAEIDPGPVAVDAEPLVLDLVYTVDASEDQPDLVSVILPVREAIYARWEEHGDDLQLLVAARVVEGLYRAAQELGAARAHAMHGGHRGMLAVELELAPPRNQEAARKVGDAIAQIFNQSPEMVAAKLTVRVTQVRTDYLLPPDEADREVSDDA